MCTLTDVAVQTNSVCLSPEEIPDMPPGISEDEARKLQEEQDAVSMLTGWMFRVILQQ